MHASCQKVSGVAPWVLQMSAAVAGATGCAVFTIVVGLLLNRALPSPASLPLFLPPCLPQAWPATAPATAWPPRSSCWQRAGPRPPPLWQRSRLSWRSCRCRRPTTRGCASGTRRSRSSTLRYCRPPSPWHECMHAAAAHPGPNCATAPAVFCYVSQKPTSSPCLSQLPALAFSHTAFPSTLSCLQAEAISAEPAEAGAPCGEPLPYLINELPAYPANPGEEYAFRVEPFAPCLTFVPVRGPPAGGVGWEGGWVGQDWRMHAYSWAAF